MNKRCVVFMIFLDPFDFAFINRVKHSMTSTKAAIPKFLERYIYCETLPAIS